MFNSLIIVHQLKRFKIEEGGMPNWFKVKKKRVLDQLYFNRLKPHHQYLYHLNIDDAAKEEIKRYDKLAEDNNDVYWDPRAIFNDEELECIVKPYLKGIRYCIRRRI